MATMRSIRRAMRHIPVVLAFTLSMAGPPAHATDLAADRSELIQSLLPAVVNISVRKDVTPPPTAPQEASASAGSGEAKTPVQSLHPDRRSEARQQRADPPGNRRGVAA